MARKFLIISTIVETKIEGKTKVGIIGTYIGEEAKPVPKNELVKKKFFVTINDKR